MRTTTPQYDLITPSPEEFSAWINPAPPVYEAVEASPWRRHKVNRVDLLIAVVLFGCAIMARWPLIQRGETLLHSDEAIVGLMAQDIADGTRYPIYFYGQRYMGALEAYVIAMISPYFDNPIHALRFGPALFFAALVAVQYLMLAGWFGRTGGAIGAGSLIFAAPMFAQWSISARGGYIEILLWGTMLLWAYGAWFVENGARSQVADESSDGCVSASRVPLFRGFKISTIHRLVFGAIIGSGFWINPSIVLFVAPIIAHRLLQLIPARGASGHTYRFERLRILTLPAVLLVTILLLNCLWYVYVDHGRVYSQLLLGLVSKPVAVVIIAGSCVAACYLIHRQWNIVEGLRNNASAGGVILLGMIIGALPAVWYTLRSILGIQPMDPSLPLGLRPIWTIGETVAYLWHGMPLLFGADARPFLELVTIGRPSPIGPLDIITNGSVLGANLVVLGAALTAAMTFLLVYRDELARVLRLTSARCSPAMLLLIGAVGTIMLFLFSGAAHDFNTIRYLIPIWAFLPGLLASIVVQTRVRSAARLAPFCLMAAWGLGQFAMYLQLGRPHPLRPLADALVSRSVDTAVAEIFDAHLLSYLTRQSCRVAEYDPFWSRLGHYQPAIRAGAMTSYVVMTDDAPVSPGDVEWRYPGPPPPEVHRSLSQKLQVAIQREPERLDIREPLPGGFEIIRLNKK